MKGSILRKIIGIILDYNEVRYVNAALSRKQERHVDLTRTRRILCLQMNAIGDALMTQPAWAAIAGHFPDATVDLACSPHIAPLFENDPLIYKIRSLEKSRYRPWLFDDFRAVNRILSNEKYDMIFDFTALPLTAALCARIDMPPSVGFQRMMRTSTGVIDLGRAYDFVCPYSEDAHLRTLMSDLVASLFGIEHGVHSPRLYLDDVSLGKASALITDHGLKEKSFVIVHPGAKWAPKAWPVRHWQELIRILSREMNESVFILGGVADKKMVDEILSDSRICDVPHYISSDIGLSAALIQSSALCLCHDSAPMHMAAALAVSSVSLFGPVSPHRSAPPENEGCRVIYRDMFCSPCTLYYAKERCRRGINFCMHAINPDEVSRTVGEFLHHQ